MDLSQVPSESKPPTDLQELVHVSLLKSVFIDNPRGTSLTKMCTRFCDLKNHSDFLVINDFDVIFVGFFFHFSVIFMIFL